MVDYSEAFWISIAGIAVGVIGLAIRACMKSRCTTVELGCLRIERDVLAEEREAELALTIRKQKSHDENSLNDREVIV